MINLALPKVGIPVTDKPMSADWYKYHVRMCAAVQTTNVAITADAAITTIGVVYVDATAGAVTVTPSAFPITLQKIDASANAVTVGGITVNGNPAFSFNTQYEAWTIDTVGGLFYARQG